ncbi:hypothetical protein H4R33_004855 [Dimargaris cristalligena]|nr:hypothetical protein H4R33_004855 [Dimargaris cristalligena]
MMVLDRIAQKRRVQWQDVPKIKGSVAKLTELLAPKAIRLQSQIKPHLRKKETKQVREQRVLAELRAQLARDGLATTPSQPVTTVLKDQPTTATIPPEPIGAKIASTTSAIATQLPWEEPAKPNTSASLVKAPQETAPLVPSTATNAPDPLELVRWQITLLKPKLLMNISGKSVARAAKEYGVSIDNILIVHDDMQRDIGKVALKEGGSANGHNGIKSAIDHLGTSNFRRLRIGIGRPPDDNRSNDLVARFVLSKFTPVESEKLEQLTYKYCLENWPSAFIDL